MGTLPPTIILQLEDSDLDLELELAHLRRAGIDVQSTRVERRAEFCQALENQKFDVILADFHLSDFNGLEALAIAREIAPTTPFIFVTGMLGEEIAIDSLRSGATDYVMKTRMSRLGPAVQRAISEARERAERRRIASALIESENRFRNMADFAPVLIWVAGPDKNWNYCNRPWLDFTGLLIEQCSGSGWTSVVHPQDLARVVDNYDRAFETRQEFTIEYRIRRHDGHYRFIVNRAVPRFSLENEFAGFIGSCTDTTELKAAEARLRNAAKLESLGILAGGIAHDFNNLLFAIMGNAAIVLKDLPRGTNAAQCVEEIVQAAETAARLTGQILAYSGGGAHFLERISLSRVVRDSLPLIKAAIPHRIKLDVRLSRGLPPIEADSAQLRLLVMSFVINAAEAVAADNGGVVTIITGTESVDSRSVASMLSSFPVQPGRYVTFRIHDNGTGMDMTTKDRMFDPFFSTKFTGRGLGLSAVSGIVRGHKGGIRLTSEPGKGADFCVYFPISLNAQEALIA